MKALPIGMLLAVFAASPLASAADDPPKKPTTTTPISSTPSVQQDSPLVRAAKATGRLNKKPAMVITNEMLIQSGGHLSASTHGTMAPIPGTLPTATPTQATAASTSQPAVTAVDKARRDTAVRSSADYSGESIEAHADDPAMQERQMTPPPAPKKPPGE